MKIEVAYALPDEQFLLTCDLPEGVTVQEAINASGILKQCPDIDLSQNKVGIFSKLAKLDTVLREGDRVEIYRPLIADPKEVRRKKALEKSGKK